MLLVGVCYCPQDLVVAPTVPAASQVFKQHLAWSGLHILNIINESKKGKVNNVNGLIIQGSRQPESS